MVEQSPGPRPGHSYRLYVRLLGYVRPYWRQFAASLFGMVVVAATEPAIPALFKPLLDQNFVGRDPGGILWMPLALMGLFLVRGLGDYVADVAIAWVGGKVVYGLRMQMFQRLLHLPARFFDDHSAGVVISKVTYDVSQVTQAATKVLDVVVRDTLAVAGLLGWMLYLNWRLTLVALVVAPPVVLIVRAVSRRLRDISRSLQRTYGEMTHVLEEATEGHRIVKIFGGQRYEAERFGRSANWVRRYTFKSRAAAGLNVPLVQFTTASGLAAIVFIASRQAVDGTLTVGAFVSFLGAMGMLFSPIKRLTQVSEPLQRGLAAAESIFDMVDEPVEADQGARPLARATGRLELRGVTFRYDRTLEPAVRELSLTVEPGETVALVGPSGGGKTTVAHLVPRFYDLEGGQILIDGQDIVPMSEAELNKVRLKMGMVFQYSALFDSMTVGENVAFGLREHTKLSDADIKEIVREKLHLVGLDGVEDMMPNELSGGMKKRVSLARAIAVEPSIICYDEPSSGLDPLMTEKIDELIINTQKALSVTSIVVTHDMASACRISDRIAMIYDGELIAVDTVERFKKIKDARVQAFFRTLRTVKSEKEDER